MRELLLKHMERYPKMQVTDTVKLLYQSEFGGGHMIANPAKSLEWIKKEWEEMKPTKDDVSVGTEMSQEGIETENGEPSILIREDGLEEIGGGLCRVSLKALDEGLSPETLNQMFVKTADQTVGTIENFEKKLDILKALCIEGKTPFLLEELDQYLKKYQAEGYPPVSHSAIYRESYHPAYRVAAINYTRYYPVFLEIDRALASSEENQVTVAIDGMCGSGKSTLARILEAMYDCNVFHMDDFFLRPEQRTPKRLEEPGGNVDYERFKEEVLEHISDGGGFSYQIYDCSCQKLTKEVKVPYKRLNIIEGAYSLHPYFESPYDLRFFCKINEQEQRNRILKRNGAEMLERFKSTWIPMELRYFKAFEIEKDCILVE